MSRIAGRWSQWRTRRRGAVDRSISENENPAQDFEVEFRWKEVVIYWEGSKGVVFDGGWGVEPIETYVQDEESWDLVMPTWLVGRRSEVVARLKANKFHVVRTDPGLAGREVELVYR